MRMPGFTAHPTDDTAEEPGSSLLQDHLALEGSDTYEPRKRWLAAGRCYQIRFSAELNFVAMEVDRCALLLIMS